MPGREERITRPLARAVLAATPARPRTPDLVKTIDLALPARCHTRAAGYVNPGEGHNRAVSKGIAMSTPNLRPVNPPTVEPRAQTLRLQSMVNRVIRGALRTPLLCRLVGKRLVTVYAVGRKSGRRYAVPVAYTRSDGTLLIGTPFAWARNLRTGDPVDIRLAGKRMSADVEVFTDEPRVVEQFAEMCRDNHAFAQFNRIGFDDDGNPNRADLHLAWAAGARAIRLTPR